jgi:hypothetical protein
MTFGLCVEVLEATVIEAPEPAVLAVHTGTSISVNTAVHNVLFIWSPSTVSSPYVVNAIVPP